MEDGGERPAHAASLHGSSLCPREGVACASAGGRVEVVKGLNIFLHFIIFKVGEKNVRYNIDVTIVNRII